MVPPGGHPGFTGRTSLGCPAVTSGWHPGTVTIDLDRHVPFDALFNVRDLGGYATTTATTPGGACCSGPTA